MAKPEARHAVVWVRWYDASYQRGECTVDDLVPRVELESAGLLVRENADTVTIALDWHREDKVWRYIQHIPRVNIRAMKQLKA